MLTIRFATVEDAALLWGLIRELAEYEHEPDKAVATAEDLARDGFGAEPKFRALIAEWDGEAAGYALFLGTIPLGLGGPEFFWKICLCGKNFAGRPLAKRYWPNWRGLRDAKIVMACDGKCWTGISPPLIFTRGWAPFFKTDGNPWCFGIRPCDAWQRNEILGEPWSGNQKKVCVKGR